MVIQQQMYRKIPVESWEVGAELLDILSRGLYSDAKDAIREYVQNSVDAQAKSVVVTVRGPRATIRDDGTGMDWDTLRRARRFGISDKNPRLHVGFRGIGMYAAFGMCERLRITTHQSGASDNLHLEIHFGEMRRILEHDRSSDNRIGVGLAELLHDYTLFREEPYEGSDLNEHFTLVTLEGINQEYRSQLNNIHALDAYLLNTLPVAFPNDGYGPDVNEWLREHVNLNPVSLICRVGDEPEFAIAPHIAENVETPQIHWLKDTDNQKIAFIWHALTTKGERIRSQPGEDERSGISGFLLKVKGFTLGDRLLLKSLWPAVGGRTLYHHYSGEIHILDHADVYPNAARDDLEPSLSKQFLIKQLEDYFVDLNRRADLTRDILKTQRRMLGIRDTLKSFQNLGSEPDNDPFESYRKSQNFLEVLERTEKDLTRLRRGRRAVQPTPIQDKQIQQLRDELRSAQTTIRKVVRRAGQRTSNARTSAQTSLPETPPRVALITKAQKALQAMRESGYDNDNIVRADERLVRASRLRSVAQAVEIFDDLKATGAILSEAAEASRKELRTHLGWSPVGPVSLAEALADSGFLPASEREQFLIKAIDAGILNGLGNRGERYEAVIRAIADSVSEQDQLR